MDLKEDGSFKLNMKYFNYATGLTMTNKKFSDFSIKPRDPKKFINRFSYGYSIIYTSSYRGSCN